MIRVIRWVWLLGISMLCAIACESETSGDRAVYASDGDNDDEANADPGEVPYTPSDYYQQCTDFRCQFVLVEGDRMVMDVATWHKDDTGFRLEGDPVVMSVSDEYAAHPAVPVCCYTVNVLGRWADDASVFLEVDGEYGIFGLTPQEAEDSDVIMDTIQEGTTHYSKRLPSSDWELMTFELKTLSYRGRLDFSIRKTGAGEALFYIVEINGKNSCTDKAIAVE